MISEAVLSSIRAFSSRCACVLRPHHWLTMSLSHGRFTAVMPGPTVVPERVLNAMHRAPPNIYGPESQGWTKKLKVGLCTVARTKQHVAMYIGNGHAAWEAAIQNLVNVGDTVLLVVGACKARHTNKHLGYPSCFPCSPAFFPSDATSRATSIRILVPCSAQFIILFDA